MQTITHNSTAARNALANFVRVCRVFARKCCISEVRARIKCMYPRLVYASSSEAGNNTTTSHTRQQDAGVALEAVSLA